MFNYSLKQYEFIIVYIHLCLLAVFVFTPCFREHISVFLGAQNPPASEQ